MFLAVILDHLLVDVWEEFPEDFKDDGEVDAADSLDALERDSALDGGEQTVGKDATITG